jgi:RHS repeat-associated protein
MDFLGRRSESVYNEKGELIASIAPDNTPNDPNDNPRMQTRYDAAGRKVAEIDQMGRETHFVYDKVGRLVETILPDSTPLNWDDNARTKTEYYTDGLVKAQIDELGHRTEFRYDDLGRQIAVIAADSTPNDLSNNPTTRYVYDKAGQQKSMTDALDHTTTYEYDQLGRMTKTIFADQSFVKQEYDKLGRRVAAVDQNGKRTEYRYDDLGRLTGVKDALQDWTSYGYNEIGQMVSMTDAEQHTTRYEYDQLGRRSATILPLNQRSSMSYDSVGNLKTTTDFDGKTITLNYDERNRLSEKVFQDGSKVVYAYTRNNLQDTVTFLNAAGTVTASYHYDYDLRNRLVNRTDVIDGVARSIGYGYDIGSNQTSLTTAAGTTTYTYDERNRLDLVRLNGALEADYDYDAVSNLTQTTFGNGTRENRSYDALNRLGALETKRLGDGVQLSKYVYTLDKVGNRTAVTEAQNGQGRAINYTYDDLYRLTGESIVDGTNGNRTSTYVYDKVGNRQTKTVNGTTTTYSYDANDRLLNEKVAGTITVQYSYDDNGSTLTKTENGVLTTYVWNDEKRLVSATVGTTQVEYVYNDQGIRVSSKQNGVETRYLLDEGMVANVWEEYAPNGTVQAAYVYGHDLITQTQAGQTSYYLVDGLGSTRLLTDNQGQVLNAYAYEAFGETVSQTGMTSNQYQFAGEQFDAALGDYYLRQRFYDTNSGRFGRMDTWEGIQTSPLTQQKYIYTQADPINGVDPSGFTNLTDLLLAINWMEVLAAVGVVAVVAAVAGEIAGLPLTRSWIRLGFISKKSWSRLPGETEKQATDKVAKYILMDTYPTSKRENIEYAGEIVKMPDTGKYHYTGPYKGANSSSTTESNWYQNFAFAVADYHTHGDARPTRLEEWLGVVKEFGPNEAFSDDDRKLSGIKGLHSYLITPGGKIMRYDAKMGEKTVEGLTGVKIN